MVKLSGSVSVDVTLKNDEVVNLDIDAGEFGLEGDGDWEVDKDDGELKAGFLYIAFYNEDEIDFHLEYSFNIHGNVINDYGFKVTNIGSGVEKIEIVSDDILIEYNIESADVE